MTRFRLYLSFDVEHDEDLRERLLEEQLEASFAIESATENGKMDEHWDVRVRRRIAAADEVLVLCGEHSDASPRMSAELRIAQEERKPYLLLWGRRGSMCKKPLGARNDDAMYLWTPAALEENLAATIRKARPTPVPDSLKRAPTTPRA